MTALLREEACFYRTGETQSGPTLTGVLSLHAEHARESTSAQQSEIEELIIPSKQNKALFFNMAEMVG
jgi:hypothetical protein